MSSPHTKDQKKFYENQVRRLLIMDSSLSGTQIHKILRKNGIRIGYHYVLSILKKIEKNRGAVALNYTLTTYLQSYVEALTEAERQLWKIITDPTVSPGQKIFALQEVRNNRSALFEKLFEAGVFEKQLGKLKLETLTSVVKEITLATNAKREQLKIEGGGDAQPLADQPGDLHADMLGEGLGDMGGTAEDPQSDHTAS